MSLAKKISQFRVVANAVNHDIDLQNMDITWEGEDYSDVLTAIGGKKYKNMAGLRARVEITYNQNIAAAAWRALINDIITDFVTNGVDSIEFYPDATKLTASDKIDVIPTESTYQTMYENQVGRFVPSISLEGQARASSITLNFGAP